LRNHVAGVDAMDFLVVPTINFRLLFVLVIVRHERRRLISLRVTDRPRAEWTARQITEAFLWDSAPTHLIRDRDASYGHAVTKRLAAMGIRDHPIAPRSPWQNGHVERLIGSICRECLDHIVIMGEATGKRARLLRSGCGRHFLERHGKGSRSGRTGASGVGARQVHPTGFVACYGCVV